MDPYFVLCFLKEWESVGVGANTPTDIGVVSACYPIYGYEFGSYVNPVWYGDREATPLLPVDRPRTTSRT